jgi:hypothetical protein
LVTCISPLLLSECFEGQVLETRDLGLEETQIDGFHPRTFDVEDRQASPVDAADLDTRELATAGDPEGPEEEILGLHRLASLGRASTAGGEFAKVGPVRGEPSLL